MERPLSSGSTTTVPATAGPTHKRNASVKNIAKASGPSTVALFVANLRLLNLDLLPDWPNITTASFSNQDARTKIKCTEYALYHLFRLHDPATAAEKLQPFFPPLEPLQSVNLRAALFRCLNELKKNGVLPKETVLRKTMLDDCQGDKFWEVCLSFSATVLRQVTLEKKAKYGKPIAEKIGIAQSVGKNERESMLPLAIAHKAALAKVLDAKRRKKDTYVRLYDLLAEKDNELKERKVKSKEDMQKAKALQSDKLKAVDNAIQKSWVGSTELKDALIDGDTCAKGDGILVDSFDELWRQDGEKELTESNGAEVGLLQSLSSKATQQSVRLRMWQNYLDRLVAAKPSPLGASRPKSGVLAAASRFDRHREVNLRPVPSDDTKGGQPPAKQPRHTSASRYDEILTAMREELRKNSGHRSGSSTSKPPITPLKRAQTQPVPARKPTLALDTSPGAPEPLLMRSNTAVPVGPRMGRRVSSQSRSYEKRKVESQREPIPLKSELFSPLKEKRQSVSSIPSTNVSLPSPTEEDESPDEMTHVVVAAHTDDVVPGEQSREPANGPETPYSGTRNGKYDDKISSSDTEFKTPALPTKKANPGVVVGRPSLAERTRMSIAFNSSEDVTGLLPDQPLTDSSIQSSDDVPAITEPEHSNDRRASLLERTRQSISMAPPPVPTSKKSHKRSRSSLFPVNQFETPKKTRMGGEQELRRDATPIEQLLSPDAEYESVFKSRPKIALSPVLSPFHDAEANGNASMDSDVGPSSPLVDVGGRG